jgi:crotonobetainyl-CoA:carnitine CoA-transferase CaiB-like acyl-CoA transferase
MYDVMQGVRVIEVAEHTFVPAAAMVLADWGADVIKVERATGGGDPARSLRILQRPGQSRNAFFEVANRGKRSIGLDLNRRDGRELLYRLVEGADVFLTSLRADARAKLGIEPADLLARNPRLVYARGTGYGTRGPMAHHGGFDFPSSWCRSGSGYAQTRPGGDPPPQQPGSVGDLTGGATLAGAIAAALFRRERTGRGGVVDHALYMMGTYIMTQSITGASLAGVRETPPMPPAPAVGHPLVRLYRTRDGRWLSLCFLQDRWFPDLARHLDREDLLDDARFTDEEAKLRNAAALVAELERSFATKTLAEWKEILFSLEGVWAPLQSPAEVLDDVQATANGFVTEVHADDGTTYLSCASPGQFDERPVGELSASPGFAQHTDAILAALGLPAAEIEALHAGGVVVRGPAAG